MKQYQDLCERVLLEGKGREDRTGTGTLSIFSHQMEFDMADGFPLITTKDMTESFEHFKGEMLWMIEGNGNANYLAEKYGFKIWRKWQLDESGDLGRVYGTQWRQYRAFEEEKDHYLVRPKTVDQLKYLINELRTNPYSRRMLLNAWNPAELDKMALPPCHWSFELYVDGYQMDTLNLKLHQRSCDVFLGVPYNIGEYALLLHMLAKTNGLKPGKLVHDMTNVHIYLNHVEQVTEQIKRKPFPLPQLWLADKESIFDYTPEDIKILNYQHHDKLTGKVSV